MTPSQFRKLALALPGAVEGAHMGHADFRVAAKLFATLGYPDDRWAVVMLKPDQQALLVKTTGDVFSAVPGGWGLKGSTRVSLAAADAATVRHALTLAWEIRAPKAKPDAKGMDRAFARVRKAAKATKLPGIAEGTSYGTPSLNVAGKFLMRMKDAETFVFRCTTEEKSFLMEAEPAIYFETDHYVGYPLVLAHASKISDAELAHCVERAWRAQAPNKLKAGNVPASERRKKSPAKKSSRVTRRL